MVNAVKMKDKIKPLLDELEEYYEYKSENATLDNEESNFVVYFQKHDETPIPLAKPSLALFHGDPLLYRQESERIRLDRLADILNTYTFPRNKLNFNDLLKAQRANKVTPFIGAGASISAGCSSWHRYLENKAKEVGISEDNIQFHLEQNKLEDLLDLILEQPKGAAFDFYFQQDFEYADPEKSYVWDLPGLFNACVITTNFDRVIEECFARQGQSFTEKTVGLNDPHTFIKAITRGERYLLKLHGNIDNPKHRVFLKREYQEAYSGNEGLPVEMNSPLPKLLSHLYRSHSFLFIGCSLDIDRTVKTFELLFEQEDRKTVADHFAIIEKPENEEKYQELERRLMYCNIKPIWFDYQQYEKVSEIIKLMLI